MIHIKHSVWARRVWSRMARDQLRSHQTWACLKNTAADYRPSEIAGRLGDRWLTSLGSVAMEATGYIHDSHYALTGLKTRSFWLGLQHLARLGKADVARDLCGALHYVLDRRGIARYPRSSSTGERRA